MIIGVTEVGSWACLWPLGHGSLAAFVVLMWRARQTRTAKNQVTANCLTLKTTTCKFLFCFPIGPCSFLILLDHMHFFVVVVLFESCVLFFHFLQLPACLSISPLHPSFGCFPLLFLRATLLACISFVTSQTFILFLHLVPASHLRGPPPFSAALCTPRSLAHFLSLYILFPLPFPSLFLQSYSPSPALPPF